MDWTTSWALVEIFSNLFYEPLLFWGAPLIPAIAIEVWKQRRRRRGDVQSS